MSRIPLLPMALEILRRYEHDAVCQARGRVLPLPSNQKMNAFMKEIAIVCGIDKVLTTHCAGQNPRTFEHQHDPSLRQIFRDGDRS